MAHFNFYNANIKRTQDLCLAEKTDVRKLDGRDEEARLYIGDQSNISYEKINECLIKEEQAEKPHTTSSPNIENKQKPLEVCGLLRCIKKLFSLKKRVNNTISSVDEPNEEDKEHMSTFKFDSDEQKMCGAAIDTFTALLSDEPGTLASLVGKEFTLTTSVSVQAIMDGSEPNIVLQGSIPFNVATTNGVKKKKVRVLGKLYSSKGDLPENYSTTQRSVDLERSCNSMSLVKVDSQFKPGTSTCEEVPWQIAERYTAEQYHYLFFEESIVDLRRQKERKTERNETELKLYEGGLHRNTSKCTGVVRNKNMSKYNEFQVKAITLSRARTKHTKYSDGSDTRENCGKEIISMKMPSGILLKCNKTDSVFKDIENENSSQTDENSTFDYYNVWKQKLRRKTEDNRNVVKRQSWIELNNTKNENTYNPLENAFTQDAFFCVKPYNNLPPPNFINGEFDFVKHYGMLPQSDNLREIKRALCQQIYFPFPPSFYRDSAEGYCPLTWLYNYYDKTKSFIRGFKVSNNMD